MLYYQVLCCVPTLLTFWMPWLPSGVTGDMFCKAEQSAISMATKSSKLAVNFMIELSPQFLALLVRRSACGLFVMIVFLC